MQIETTLAPQSEIVKWIKGILEHRGITYTRLAAETGIKQSTLSRILSGDTINPSLDTLRRLAAKSPIAVPPLVQKLLELSPVLQEANQMNIVTGRESRSILVWGTIPMVKNGEFYLNPHGISHISRDHIADKSTKLAAFYAPDETMAPRWQAGEPVIYDLARPATIGDYAVIKLTPLLDANAEETFLFRRIDRRSDGMLFVSALDESGTVAVPLSRVLEVRRVLNWSDLVG